MKSLVANFRFELTEAQLDAIEEIVDFLLDNNPETVLVISGYAGTGKTTLIESLVKTLDVLKSKSVLLAPTGRAAKILGQYTGRNSFTVHKKIYRQKSLTEGDGNFLLDRNLHKSTYFIIDEASMITDRYQETSVFGSGNLLEDIFTYVLNGNDCRLIFVGDTAQLPPVGYDNSPALMVENLTNYAGKIYKTELKDVVRQEQGSGILLNATRIRENIKNRKCELPVLSVKDRSDIVRLEGGDLVDAITSCYDKEGINQTAIITRSNKRANKYNEGIRKMVLWREEKLSVGDFLMVVKNNYHWLGENDIGMGFIANGDIAEVKKIYKYENLYGFNFADVTLCFIDYGELELKCKILIDTLDVEGPSLPASESKNLFSSVLEDYSHIKGKRNQFNKVKEDDYFNALQVKFAYAVTCHKAQGGQWKNVFIDQGYITPEMIGIDYLRWLYTSITRATEKVYLVNFSDNLFKFD